MLWRSSGEEIRVAMPGRQDQIAEPSLVSRCSAVRIGIISNARPHGVHQFPGILKFPSTLDADLIRPPSYGEYAAELLVMAPKQRFEYPQKRYLHSRALFGAIRRTQNDRWRFANVSKIAHIMAMERLRSLGMMNTCRREHSFLLAASAPAFEFQAEREYAAGVGDVSVIEQTGQPWLGKVNQGHSFERLLYGLRQKTASFPVILVPCLPRCPAKR
jgi:hypothetical protein